MAIGEPKGRSMATRPEPLTAIRPREAALTVVAATEASTGMGLPPLTSTLPAISAAGGPSGLQGPRRVLLATGHVEAMVAIEVIGRRAFLTALQAERSLVVATIPRVQDEKARDAIGGVGLEFSTSSTVAIGVVRVPSFLVPERW